VLYPRISSANSYWLRFHIGAFVFVQGHDTTSAGMSWALYLLGLHPDVQVYNDLIAEFTGTKTPKKLHAQQTFRRPVVHRLDIVRMFEAWNFLRSDCRHYFTNVVKDCAVYIFTSLKMEVVGSTKMLKTIYQTT
jgi:hypothetical protein